MQITVYDLQVDQANIDRQIAEKELEIRVLKSKLAELNVEYKRAVESSAVAQRDDAHAKFKQSQEEGTQPAQPAQPAQIGESVVGETIVG